MPAMSPFASAAWRESASGSAARVSTRSAQASGPRVLSWGGSPSLFSTDRSEARSIISTAETGPPFRAMVARAACSMSGKRTSALALCGCSTTVR